MFVHVLNSHYKRQILVINVLGGDVLDLKQVMSTLNGIMIYFLK